jgi:plasmid stabilization system protein ParE
MPQPRPRYAPAAEAQIDALFRHYDDLERTDAARNLARSLEEAEGRIAAKPDAGLRAPRPYPELARAGRRWLKAGRYWIAYTETVPAVILAVFFDAADIPSRLTPL